MLKQLKKYDSDDKDSLLISKQKEIFNELADKRLKEVIELDGKVKRNHLVYRYKGRSPHEKFDKYDNALDIISESEIKLSDAKNYQIKFKSHLSEIKKGNNNNKNQKSKKTHYTIFKYSIKQTKRPLTFLMIILQ